MTGFGTQRSPIGRRFSRYKMQLAASASVGAALHRAVPPDARNKRLTTLARRISECAANTRLHLETLPGEPTKIIYRNRRRCRSGLCPPCARKRARETVLRATRTLDDIIRAAPDTRFAFLTLTSCNMPIEEVARMLALHEGALIRFLRSGAVGRAFAGHITGIEIAIRERDGVWQAGVHSHSLVALRDGYFDRTNNIYLSQRAIVDLWKRALRVDYKPVCYVNAIADTDAARASLTECLKYAVAPHRLFERSESGFSVDPLVASCLAEALYKKRMCRAGGVFTARRSPKAKGSGT